MAELTLADDERESLVRWSRRAASAQALAQRCRTVPGRAEGKSNQQVAAELGIWPQVVGKWRRHCARPGERTSRVHMRPTPTKAPAHLLGPPGVPCSAGAVEVTP
ncbi:hypothetical protein QLX52_12385 [Streptomyces albus]|uniref:hypothetical protein n=1 Tax=Streptomyces albus TaxID=1888 RepID=UPI0024AE67BA|nr:hypothetical protein [Streptomyces albus]MDI6409632.1 hypothetical protein [Streptomyces albus]